MQFCFINVVFNYFNFVITLAHFYPIPPRITNKTASAITSGHLKTGVKQTSETGKSQSSEDVVRGAGTTG
jgi:hypothetical protein